MDGSIYFSEADNNRVTQLTSNGTLHVVAGDQQGYSGDGGPAVSAALFLPHWLALSPAGSLYIGDYDNFRIRAVSPSGIISTVAGNGKFEFSADGSPASEAFLNNPSGIAADSGGNVYVADGGNNVIRKIDSSGAISVVAGDGHQGFDFDENTTATKTALSVPQDVTVDANGGILVVETLSNRIRKLSADGSIATIAGTGVSGSSGDNGPAVKAMLNSPRGVAVDRSGNIFIADTYNHRIRKITPNGTITTFAGSSQGNAGDGGPGFAAKLNVPNGIAADSNGNVYIADSFNSCVRVVTADGGLIKTFAGICGKIGFSGDGGQARNATLSYPEKLVFGPDRVLYLSDLGNNRIRAIAPDGVISTFAGNGKEISAGDGGGATIASLSAPEGLAVDGSGTLYIGENRGNRIRAVTAGTISLQVSQSSLSLSAESNGSIPTPAPISVSSATSGLTFSVTTITRDGGKWLKSNITAGLAPATILIAADPSGLAPGTYNGTVQVIASPTVSTINVTFTVTEQVRPKLSVNSNSLAFSFVAGELSKSTPIPIANSGSGTLSFAVTATTTSGRWLAVAPGNGTAAANAPASVTITANPAGLAVGTYSGTVAIASSTTGQSATVSVTMTIIEPVRVLLLSQSGLTFRAVAGGGKPLPQTVSVLNVGAGSLSWTLQASTFSGGSWLGVSATNGTVPRPYLDISPFDVTVDAAGLAPGDYYGTIQVKAANASNSPQTISVVLNVLPAGTNPGPEVRPTGLVFTGLSGVSPSSQTFSFAQLGSRQSKFNSTRLTLDEIKWFVHAPSSGSVTPGQPVTVVIQPDFSALDSGVRYGSISIIFDDGTSRTVSILTVIAPSGNSASKLSANEASACAFEEPQPSAFDINRLGGGLQRH